MDLGILQDLTKSGLNMTLQIALLQNCRRLIPRPVWSATDLNEWDLCR